MIYIIVFPLLCRLHHSFFLQLVCPDLFLATISVSANSSAPQTGKSDKKLVKLVCKITVDRLGVKTYRVLFAQSPVTWH